jgi:Zn-dependent peptidase ImmA (M78 family)
MRRDNESNRGLIAEQQRLSWWSRLARRIGGQAISKDTVAVAVPPDDASEKVTPSWADKMPLDERQKIVNAAHFLALEITKLAHDSKLLRLSEFPVDIDVITSALGIRVFLASINDKDETSENPRKSGIIKRSKGHRYPEVVLEISDPPERQRFTQAHELAHFLDWAQGKTEDEIVEGSFIDIYFRRPDDRDVNVRDYEANTFAHYLLMPDDEVVACVQGGMTIPSMAKHFGVSIDSMKRRISYFDITTQRIPK